MPVERSARAEKTRHRKRSGPNTVDWGAVREHWLVMNLDPLRDPKLGEYTFKEVAQVFRLAKGTVSNKSVAEGWRKELIRRQKEIADAGIDRVQETAIEVEAVIRTGQIRTARGLYELIDPIIAGFKEEIVDGKLKVDSKTLAIFLSAMKEARAAAGFGGNTDPASEDAALTRIAEHRKTGGVLADLLDDVRTKRRAEV